MTAPTPQLLDPLGGLTARYFTWTAAALSGVLAVTFSALNADDVSVMPLQLSAVAAVVAAIVMVIDGVSPRRFPFGVARHASVHLLGVLAVALDCASRADGTPQLTAWAAMCLAVLLVMMGSFRPAHEVAIFSLASAVAVVLIALAHTGTLDAATAVTLVVGRGIPVLAVGLGAAAFSRSLAGRLTVWRDSSAERQEREREVMRDALLPEVSRRRQDLLEYRVGPFLQSLIDTQTLTPTDVQRARGLATAIRKDMVSDANRTWLSDVVDQLDDAGRAVDRMTRDQRTALGGLIAELRGSRSLVPGSITATVDAGPPVTVRLHARLLGRDRLRPDAYRAVLRTYFPGATVTSTLDGIDVTVTLAD